MTKGKIMFTVVLMAVVGLIVYYFLYGNYSGNEVINIAPLPQQGVSNGASSFKGPTSPPSVKGPNGPPPGGQ
ncbi:MAG: hypothetical protein HYR95_02575 [Candidatus Colwellbacteria bacterium]|nr:hypothetical protein [Candidatus Colwellbacteria bacterium]